ncbi:MULTISPECIES: hypothetical protein [unclassified Rhizobium]|uniref:hypothetical protein n=1 Tax=unclassified Rhizobium TaxID=2613769 RepID=UPI0011315F47|nr:MULTISPECIES: hypothetical protein [unclassified Rhizobium]
MSVALKGAELPTSQLGCRLEFVRTGAPWFAHRFENVISTVFAGEQIGAMVRPFGIHLEKADHLFYMMRDD